MKLDFGEFDKAYNEDIKQRKIEDSKSYKKKPQERGNFLGFTFVIVLAFFIFANIIDGYVELNSVKFENLELSERIETLNSEIVQLQVKIQQNTSGEKIEKIATEKLGMIYPLDSQKINIEQRKSFALYPKDFSVIVMSDKDQKAIGE